MSRFADTSILEIADSLGGTSEAINMVADGLIADTEANGKLAAEFGGGGGGGGGLATASDVKDAFVASPSDAQALGSLFGSALYGDGSDGDIVVDSDTFDWPDPTDVPEWQPSTEYAIGDRVKNTGDNVRVFRCISGGISDTSTPFDSSHGLSADDPPGEQRRGDRHEDGADSGLYPRVWWEQETVICQGVLEGALWTDNFTLQAGKTLKAWGWVVAAKTSATVEAGAVIHAKGGDGHGYIGGDIADNPDFGGHSPLMTLMGQGVSGPYGDGGFGNGADGNGGTNWGGGVGGSGGSRSPGLTVIDAGHGGAAHPITGTDAAGYTLTRFSILTMFSQFYLQGETIGSSGAAGGGDGVAKRGGGGGGAGSGFALLAKTLTHAGLITCKGGAGGDGESGGDTGGGGGGSGGCCVLCYNSKTGAGTVDVSGGVGGSGQGTGTNGSDGSPGDFIEFINA